MSKILKKKKLTCAENCKIHKNRFHIEGTNINHGDVF